MTRGYTFDEAVRAGEKVGIDFKNIDLDEFIVGLGVELEHGTIDSQTNVTNDDLEMTAKIAWAHLKEIPDYYTRLVKMERKAEGKE
jgi:hypothetical protein